MDAILLVALIGLLAVYISISGPRFLEEGGGCHLGEEGVLAVGHTSDAVGDAVPPWIGIHGDGDCEKELSVDVDPFESVVLFGDRDRRGASDEVAELRFIDETLASYGLPHDLIEFIHGELWIRHDEDDAVRHPHLSRDSLITQYESDRVLRRQFIRWDDDGDVRSGSIRIGE